MIEWTWLSPLPLCPGKGKTLFGLFHPLVMMCIIISPKALPLGSGVVGTPCLGDICVPTEMQLASSPPVLFAAGHPSHQVTVVVRVFFVRIYRIFMRRISENAPSPHCRVNMHVCVVASLDVTGHTRRSECGNPS